MKQKSLFMEMLPMLLLYAIISIVFWGSVVCLAIYGFNQFKQTRAGHSLMHQFENVEVKEKVK